VHAWVLERHEILHHLQLRLLFRLNMLHRNRTVYGSLLQRREAAQPVRNFIVW
jgi:hypothetical protein